MSKLLRYLLAVLAGAGAALLFYGMYRLVLHFFVNNPVVS